MSLWIIKGSDFVDALKRAFQERDAANLDYLMTEFSIADYGVTKRQKIKFIAGSWSQEAPKAARSSACRPVSKGYKKTLTLISKSQFKNFAGGPPRPVLMAVSTLAFCNLLAGSCEIVPINQKLLLNSPSFLPKNKTWKS